MTTKFVAAAVVVTALQLAVAAAVARQEGVKQTEQFIKEGGSTSQAVAEAKLQAQNTMNAYNALIEQPSKNLKGDYKKLMKQVRGMNAKVEDAREQITAMNAKGETYFSGRAANIGAIGNPELRSRGMRRLEESKKEYAHVLQGLGRAGDALQPFTKDLTDQINFLGSDLTPSAIAALKPEVAKMNQRSQKVFATADAAITRANAYFAGLRAS